MGYSKVYIYSDEVHNNGTIYDGVHKGYKIKYNEVKEIYIYYTIIGYDRVHRVLYLVGVHQ